jgi:hypothetical protein
MDEENRRLVELPCGSGATEVRLFMDYAAGRPESKVPDCCYGGPEGFEQYIIRKHMRENYG